MKLEEQPPGSTASTNAKAALGLRLTIWTGCLSGLAFVFCVATDKGPMVNDIIWGWLLFLAGYLGINMQQRKNDRADDYGKIEREKGYPIEGRVPGAAPTVTKEVTITTEKATKETVAAPAVRAAVPDPAPSESGPEGAWPDGRTGVL